MNQSIIFSLFISIIYFIIKVFETRLIKKQKVLYRPILRDSIIVFISSIFTHYILENTIQISKVLDKTPNVFIDEPDF